MIRILIFFSTLLLFLSTACRHNSDVGLKNENVLTHIVLCWLKEPGNFEHRNQIIDMTDSFNAIPGVLTARAGNPIMSDREIVDDSFDVGIIIEVKDVVDLKKYLDHPIHQKAKKEVLVPLVERVLVYDFAK
jgi:hypothetical protein